MTEPPAEAPDHPDVRVIRTFRQAARTIVRAEHRTVRERLAALVELVEQARRTATPALVQGVVWAEAERFIRGEPEPEPKLGNPADEAIRRLLRDGYIRCPRCRCFLPDEKELDRQARMRQAAVEEARRFEEAVE